MTNSYTRGSDQSERNGSQEFSDSYKRMPGWLTRMPSQAAVSAKKGAFSLGAATSSGLSSGLGAMNAGLSSGLDSLSTSVHSSASKNLPFLVKAMQPGAETNRRTNLQRKSLQQRRSLQRNNRTRTRATSTRRATKKSSFLVQIQEDDVSFLSDYESFASNSEEEEEEEDRELITQEEQGYEAERQVSCTEKFLEHAAQLERLFEEETPEEDPNDQGGDDDKGGNQAKEQKYRGDGIPMEQDVEECPCEETNKGDNLSERSLLLGKEWEGQQGGKFVSCRRNKEQESWSSQLKAHWQTLMVILAPKEVWQNCEVFFYQVFLLTMLPLLVTAYVLFYHLGNPHFLFLPRDATLAWYILLVVRWLATLALARVTQCLVPVLAIRTTIMARCTGPFVTLLAMQSMGWPFVCMFWGIWNLSILQGSSVFCKHWLWFSGTSLFSPIDNPDNGVLESEWYGRILGTMVMVGFAAALKRTIIAFLLSRRMLKYYKPQLKALTDKLKLVASVAGLAAETTKPGFDDMVSDAAEKAAQVQISSRESKQGLVTSGGGFVPTLDATPPRRSLRRVDNPDMDESHQVNIIGHEHGFDELGLDESVLEKEEDYDDATDESGDERWQAARNLSTRWKHNQARRSTMPSNCDYVMDMLESWEPPVDRRSKQSPSLDEILQFRKVIRFMESSAPFSADFGPADSRKRAVKSAIRVYKRLLKYIPAHVLVPKKEENSLTFDVIAALAYRSNGEWDQQRAEALLELFMPDHDHELTMAGFVQATDDLYKQMTFLRASISNSSKIDSVLADMFNVIFYGILALVILSLFGLNVWPLLVSVSTLIVSFTFAFGPAAAKEMQGIILIAVRRPYEIGDRIRIQGIGNVPSAVPTGTWFVDDIFLTTTILRCNTTNEVSSVENSALVGYQITNFNRSPKGFVNIYVVFRLGTTYEQARKFESRINKYVSNRPRVWERVVWFRNVNVDNIGQHITWVLRVQHAKSWQEHPTIMKQKGKLQRQADRIAHDLGIVYRKVPQKKLVKLVEKYEGQESPDGYQEDSAPLRLGGV